MRLAKFLLTVKEQDSFMKDLGAIYPNLLMKENSAAFAKEILSSKKNRIRHEIEVHHVSDISSVSSKPSSCDETSDSSDSSTGIPTFWLQMTLNLVILGKSVRSRCSSVSELDGNLNILPITAVPISLNDNSCAETNLNTEAAILVKPVYSMDECSFCRKKVNRDYRLKMHMEKCKFKVPSLLISSGIFVKRVYFYQNGVMNWQENLSC